MNSNTETKLEKTSITKSQSLKEDLTQDRIYERYLQKQIDRFREQERAKLNNVDYNEKQDSTK